MPEAGETRWTVIRAAAEGGTAAREEFVRRYTPVACAYLGARWKDSPLVREIDDASQEVFLACFQDRGALTRVDPERPGGFRAFFFGVVRNIARRFEEQWSRRDRPADSRLDLAQIRSREEPLSRIFDLAWAKTVVQQAHRLFEERSRESGDGAARRAELLRLRFREDLPIREIARLWDEDAARLHHQYAHARREFEAALRDVVRDQHPGHPERVDVECGRLVAFLRG